MDHIFGSAFKAHASLLTAIISYDIACQWFKNLFKRMTDWPEDIKLREDVDISPVIPKFHEPAHQDEDHKQFSCNLVPGMGASDCEVPEQFWGPHNPLGNSTKTMGPGSRHDILDDHFGFWNWLKYHSMGKTP